MDKSLNVVVTTGFQHYMGSDNIIVGKRKTVSKTVIYPSFHKLIPTNMTLGCKMDDCIDVFRPKNVIDKTGTQNVSLYVIQKAFSGYTSTNL